MRRLVLLTLCAATTAIHVSAQSAADQIPKREEALVAALRSGQGREQFYSKEYLNITPPGTVSVGFQPPPQPNPATYQKDVAVVVATATGAVVTLLGGPRPPAAQVPSATDPDRWIHGWANEEGTWRLVARQGIWVRPAPQSPTTPRTDVSGRAYTPANAAEAAVLKADAALNEAFRARDGAAYEANLSPEFIRISSYGVVSSRAEFVKNAVLAGTGTRRAPAQDETRVRIHGDIAVMTYRNLRSNERMMRAFVNRAGGWKAVATISTLIWADLPK
jgi:hypothetical protein